MIFVETKKAASFSKSPKDKDSVESLRIYYNNLRIILKLGVMVLQVIIEIKK